MVRKTVIVASLATVVVALAAAGTAFAAADGEYQATQAECKALKEAGDKDGAKECRKAAREAFLARRLAQHWPKFREENGTIEGRFVSFEARDGALANFTVSGGFASTRLFDSIRLDGAEATRSATRGAAFALGERGAGLVAVNAPNAAWFAGAREGGTLVVDVADGLAVTPIRGEDGALRAVAIESGEHRAVLKAKGNATLTVEGDVITVALGKNGGAGFAIEGYPRLLAFEKRLVREAVEDGKGRARGGHAAEAALDE